MKVIDLNADLGEGIALEPELLPLISSANVCCGAHAGSPETTRSTVEACLAHSIRIGAHPGYPDPKNFGRTSFSDLNLPTQKLRQSLESQLALIPEAQYIKPHGALYNETATGIETIDPDLIQRIADNRQYSNTDIDNLVSLVRDKLAGTTSAAAMQSLMKVQVCLLSVLKNLRLPLMGLANNTPHKALALAAQVPFIAEGFIDRRYGENNRLLPRSNPDAIIKDPQEAIDQALRLAQTCDSLCVHGDNPEAPQLLAKVRQALEKDGYNIVPK